MTFTSVIRHGLVHDGLGGRPRHADVGIAGDRIAVIGDIPPADCPEIDATGLVVAPGLINVLSHAWQTIQLDGSCQSDLVQGVTTEVFGEAISLGPSSEALLEMVPVRAATRLDFPRLSAGLDHIEAGGTSVNVASFIGGQNLRALAAGADDRRLTNDELKSLCALVDEEMAAGALGIATALIYAPENYATTEELTQLCTVVGRHDGLYISHLRSEGDRLLECLNELIGIGQAASCRVQAYHLKAAGAHNHHKMPVAIERIVAARAAGQQVSADMYPYTAACTDLAAVIPPRHHAGGPAALLDRLADPAVRAEIIAELESADGGFENLFVGADRGHGIVFLRDLADGTPAAGQTLVDVAWKLGIAQPAAALLDIVRGDPTQQVCYFVMSEDNVRLGLGQPWVSICSDAEAVGPASLSDDLTHPRAYGTFARILGHYSRDLELFPLAEAIRKMTSLPADTLRLADRGRLAPGAFADVIVFDPATITDTAKYDAPRRYAVGMHHVLVNGEQVLRDGQVLPARPGRRLRRGR
ncbi:dihydroorotase [Amycolatopsis sp. NBRC 101858]|uniref:N-acyl-D-amino-acid deacylase family protein n=1 Tax=Amycolatopsis sp. NBRC 101858 TaxID=3032200 RepID=UPI0024A473A0|nr:amidohydrolase family protein [Amycolatopsis sp. NBRC 101858]GLY42896.1 dihydroorotase [Amycolatopsis sp. NBRC 101858]